MRKLSTEQLEAVALLQKWLNPGDTIYCISKSVSRTGATHTIELLHASCDNGKPGVERISPFVARALDIPFDSKRGGVRVHGGGMDMGVALMEDLTFALGFTREQRLQRQWL